MKGTAREDLAKHRLTFGFHFDFDLDFEKMDSPDKCFRSLFT
jgi:hypothetical protein